jgi:hypothetical protein
MEYAVSLVNGANVIGTYSFQGEVNPKVLEKIKQKDSPPPCPNGSVFLWLSTV